MELLLFIISIVISLVIFLFYLIKISYVKAPPNTAFIISGLSREPRVLVGKGGIRIPFFGSVVRQQVTLLATDFYYTKKQLSSDFCYTTSDKY